MDDLNWTKEAAQALGSRIADARKAKGWSLDRVADALRVSRGTAGHWETGARTIKVGDLTALCELLNVSADKLLFGTERWPFEKVDYEMIASLDKVEISALQGGLIVVANQLGLDVSKRLAA